MKSRAERPASQDASAALKRRGDGEPSSNCVRPSHMHAAIQTEVCGYLHRGMRTKQKTWTDMFAFLYTLLYTNTHHSYELEFGSHPCTNPLLLCLLSFSFSFFNYNFIIRYVWVQKGVCCLLFEVVQQLYCNMGDSLCMYYI